MNHYLAKGQGSRGDLEHYLSHAQGRSSSKDLSHDHAQEGHKDLQDPLSTNSRLNFQALHSHDWWDFFVWSEADEVGKGVSYKLRL